MKTKCFLMACVAILLLAGGCITISTKPKAMNSKPIVLTNFSEKLIKEYDLTSEKLKRIQFFSSDDSLVFQRSISEKSDTILNGKIISRDLEKIYFVKVKPFTKGKMLDFSQKVLKISFENDSLFLFFGPDLKGDYVLYGIGGKNKVKYGDSEYDVTYGGDGKTKLFVNLEQLKLFQKVEKVVPGISVQ